jgi:aspartate aminotransferase/aminotransferase
MGEVIMISRRALMVDSSGIRKVFDLAAKLKDPVNLSIGQPDFDVPEELKEEAIKAIKKGFNRYTVTQGIEELRFKVLEHIEKTRGKKYELSNVIITSGVSGGLLLALFSIINPGDEIVFFDPYFVMYKHLVNLLDGKPVIVDTYPDFKISEEKLKNAVNDKTKAIILNSPCNPTGYVYTQKDIETIVKIARERNILLISDEIYDGFVYDERFISPVSCYDKVLILGGFSKTYAMTGWRLGYAVGDAELIAQMIKLQQYSFVCAPSPFQYAAVKALDFDTTHFRNAYKRKRDLVYEGLKEKFDVVKPGGAFYIYPALRKGSVDKFVELAISNNVLIIPGNVFSEKNTNFRISFAAKDEDILRGVDILNRIIDNF